ncbi:hypothetical protein L3Q82_025313 [Scortum barcoo]|uniref:Uncharacterized protein n=1 Tax=Scortum barcoo TaxID=214431 RepID=A0ACB8WTE8_9TELE|nr:hypothetical protein L3Q82_025313 [Scortum barcoo]
MFAESLPLSIPPSTYPSLRPSIPPPPPRRWCSIYLHLLFSLLFLAICVFLSTPLCPPPYAVCHCCREERKMLRPTKVRRERRKQKRVEERKTVRAGVCLQHSDASIHHESDSLMEYPGRQRAKGRTRGRGRRKSRREGGPKEE